MTPVDILAQTLTTSLIHPGDDKRPAAPIPTPFRATGLPDDQAQEIIGDTARIWAEAIIHTLEQHYELMPKPEADQLRQDAADAPDGTRHINIRTTPAGKPVLQLTIGKADDVIVPSRALKAAAEVGR